MVSALDFGASAPGLSPARDIVLCSWARHLTLTVPLSTQVYKWLPVNLMLGVTQSLHATETGISSGLMGHYWAECRFYLLPMHVNIAI